jgi:ParB-like chromosome segregation protein Spo0J
MTVQLVPVSQAVDNQYNPRSHYDQKKIEELASSIGQNGLLEVPKAHIAALDTFEIAYGGYRLRAFKYLEKNQTTWGPMIDQYVVDGKLCMPLDVIEISDTSMVIYALEENLKRQNMSPIDTARAIAKYFEIFPGTKEDDLAKRLSMTQGAISNMVRTMTLPAEVLKYVDSETINFTQARELCILIPIDGITKGTVESKLIMIDAINMLGTEGVANTVGGIKKAIHKVVHNTFRPLATSQFGVNPEFDVNECQGCDKNIKTTGDDNKTAYHCIDSACWDIKQANAKRKKEEDRIAQQEKDAAELKAKADTEAEELKKKTVPIPEGIRLAEEARKDGDCENCTLGATDHTIKFSYPNEKGAFRQVCIKDYMKVTGTKLEDVPTVAPKENISQEISRPKPRTFYVSPKKLNPGGDIYESFSTMEILEDKPIHASFHEAGEDYVSAGDYPDIPNAKQAYRMIPRADYNRDLRSLKTPEGMDAKAYRDTLKNDPLGPLNGVMVTNESGQEFVLVGPIVVFTEWEKKPEVAPAPTPSPETGEKNEEEGETSEEESENESESEVEETTSEPPANQESPAETPASTPITTVTAYPAPEKESVGTKYKVSLTYEVTIDDRKITDRKELINLLWDAWQEEYTGDADDLTDENFTFTKGEAATK